MDKPFAPACERNQTVILEVLKQTFKESRRVLEIGSGTGQHAVHFGATLSHLQWQTSDLAVHHQGIQMWVAEANLTNVQPPVHLDVTQDYATWPSADAVFTANTLHIISWPLAKRLITGVGNLLPSGGNFCIYGPFNYEGEYTSQSNAQFDVWLKNRDPLSSIRNFEAVVQHAKEAGLILNKDYEMPANNRILHFTKIQ